LEKLSNNLLAFSAGVDSTALFFKLVEENISFDIAIVNYHKRKQADEEVEYAKKLAKKYNKKIFIKNCFLENSNFEMNARNCRYKFFEEIIKKYHYSTLFIAHQLNDKMEWFLMQFSKGAGLKELLSMPYEEKREFYNIKRPLIKLSRDEILEYLHKNNIKYFIDESNEDTKYKRNYFRKEFASKFVKEFKYGIKRSFEYLEIDKELLFQKDWIKTEKLYKFKKSNPQIDIKKVDLIIKELGYILSKPQRDEIIKTNFSLVIGGKIAIDSNEEYIFISPFIKTKKDKRFKEKMRVSKIPPKVRGYLFTTQQLLS
jgi:tRNA(Ile)-lysidine synthase